MTAAAPRLRLAEVGVGSGSGDLEYAAFGKDVARRRQLTTEHLELLRRALSGEEVRAAGFRIQPAPADFTDRIWQGVFSGSGARHAATGGSNLLLNRAAYGHDAPTDAMQRPWADAYRAAWDRRTALRMADGGAFPKGLDEAEALRRFHAFYGHPDEIVAALAQERVLPVATDLITQFNSAVPDLDTSIRALELIATDVAPALGWRPAPAPELAGVRT